MQVFTFRILTPLQRRRAAVSPAVLLALATVVVLVALIALLRFDSSGSRADHADGELMLYCAAGMRLPVEEIVADYQREYGTAVHVQYGGSNTLLGQIEVTRSGDLFLAADDSYLQLAGDKGLVAETLPLARMQAVVGVPRGNPRGIDSLDDLLAEDLRLVVANPDQAAIGKVVRQALQEAGKWEAIEEHTRQRGVFKPTVNDAANDIKLGSAGAGFLWDAVAAQYPEIDVVRLPELANATVEISVGVLQSSKQPTAALRFTRYLAARDRGLKVFAEDGYPPVEGDVWQERPKLTLYAGAINRRALEPIVKTFADREGVEVITKYNGCGILTADMRALGAGQTGFPDAFMACDQYYLDEVQDWFHEGVQISSADIVMVVARGNPHHVQSLDDLAKPGLRVALGQPQQCTIGVLSRRLLTSAGLDSDALRENIVAELPSSAMIVPSVTTGAADVALVYITDAQAERDRLEILPIDSPLAKAIQPYGIARSSDHQQLGQRLLDAIKQSRDQFEVAGFEWRLPDEPAE